MPEQVRGDGGRSVAARQADASPTSRPSIQRLLARIASARASMSAATAATGVSLCAAASATRRIRSEEHTSELQSLMRISYAVFCLKKKKQKPAYVTRRLHQKSSAHRKRHK